MSERSVTVGDALERWAIQQPDHAAVIMGQSGAVTTYHELHERSLRLAQTLRDWGIRRGDGIAICDGESSRVPRDRLGGAAIWAVLHARQLAPAVAARSPTSLTTAAPVLCSRPQMMADTLAALGPTALAGVRVVDVDGVDGVLAA